MTAADESSSIHTAAGRSSTALTLSANEDDNAEDLFRTGLKLYNNAFTKVGKEKEALLISAISFLSSVEERNIPHLRNWVALSLILIADSHRALGQVEDSINTYHRMIDSFPELDSYCEQSWVSIVKLHLEQNNGLCLAEQTLDQFKTKYPNASEFSSLALAIAEKIQDSSPESAYKWCDRVIKQCPDADPLKYKAERLAREVEKKLLDQTNIQDWWIYGPVEREAAPSDIPGLNTRNRLDVTSKSKNGKISWIRPFPDGQGSANLASAFKSKKDSAAMAITYVWCSEDQTLGYAFEASDGFRVWINDRPVFGQVWGRGCVTAIGSEPVSSTGAFQKRMEFYPDQNLSPE